MKKMIILILMLISAVGFSQTLVRQTVHDTTRVDGTRFVVSYPYEQVTIMLADSMRQVGENWETVGNYLSMANSYVVFKASRLRIIGSDTLSRGETIAIPLNEIGTNAVQFLTGVATRKQVKKETKPWISRKLNQE